MDDQAFCISDIGKVRKQLYGIDKFLSSLEAAFYSETDDRSIMPVEIFFCDRMIRIVFKTRVNDPVYRAGAPSETLPLPGHSLNASPA